MRPGARRFLDYIYLNDEEIAAVRWMLDHGVSLFAQDLPGSPRHPLERLLSDADG
jgi:hypothetical protein